MVKVVGRNKSKQGGFSLVEVIVASGILIIASFATIKGTYYLSSNKKNSHLKSRILELRTSIINTLDTNSTSFFNTVYNPLNTNFSCIQNTTNCAGQGGSFSLYLGDNLKWIDSQSSFGFRDSGEICHSFNWSGSDACPLRVDLSWEPVCDLTQCHGGNLRTLQINVKFSYVPSSGFRSDTSVFDMSIHRLIPDPPASPFVTVWRITLAGQSVILPLVSGYNYDAMVDWGDGSPVAHISSWNDSDRSHTYGAAGDYTVEISGVMEAWNFLSSPVAIRSRLREVVSLGNMQWKNLEYAFSGCSGLTSVRGGVISDVTSLKGMFAHSTALSFVDTNGWNTSNVISMEETFMGNLMLNPDVTSWDTGKVKSMAFMFGMAISATPNVRHWNTSQVTDMRAMFMNAIAANPNVSKWDTGAVTDMSSMFWNASSANPDVSKWDTSSLVDVRDMFGNASSADPNVTHWDTSNMQLMRSMFLNATSANPDVSGWEMGNAVDISNMFQGATSANPDVSGWDTSNVSIARNVFSGATSANPDVSSWNTSNMTQVNGMFEGATSAAPDFSSWDFSGITVSGTFDDFLSGTIIPTSNYNTLLVRLAATLPVGAHTVDGGGAQYTNSGAPLAARNSLISAGWTINDGGGI